MFLQVVKGNEVEPLRNRLLSLEKRRLTYFKELRGKPLHRVFWQVVTPDKGYVYEPKSKPYLDVRPEEKKTGYVIFEILEQTSPVEVSYRPFLSTSVAASADEGEVIQARVGSVLCRGRMGIL